MTQQVSPSRDDVLPLPSRATLVTVIKPEENADDAFEDADADAASGQWRSGNGTSKRTHDDSMASSSMADSKSMVQDDDDDDDAPSPRSKKARASRGGSDKHSKGLRQFSLKVCQKVESKGSTTYNEVCAPSATRRSERLHRHARCRSPMSLWPSLPTPQTAIPNRCVRLTTKRTSAVAFTTP